MLQLNPITLIIGLIFCPIAALMAFFITYGEYSRHYSDKKKPLKIAFQAAILAFIFFAIISVSSGIIIGSFN